MKFVKQWLIALVLFPIAASAQEKVMVNDPNAQVRQVSGFTEISVSSSIDLYLSPDDRETVVVSARTPELRDKIVTRVTGNKLEIFWKEKNFSMRSDMRLKAYVSFKQLKKINAGGSSDVYVNGIIKSDNLVIDIHGSSDFSGAVDVQKLDIRQSGSSDSKLSGRAGVMEVDLSGSSDMKAFDLNTDVCNANASGSSDISVTVMKELFVKASGASDIKYKGTGTVREAKTSGSSSIRLVRE